MKEFPLFVMGAAMFVFGTGSELGIVGYVISFGLVSMLVAIAFGVEDIE